MWIRKLQRGSHSEGLESGGSQPPYNCSRTALYSLFSLALNLFRGWAVRTPASNLGLPDSNIGSKTGCRSFAQYPSGTCWDSTLVWYKDCVIPQPLQFVVHKLLDNKWVTHLKQHRRISALITLPYATSEFTINHLKDGGYYVYHLP